ncbi:MAG: hypothetical protein EXS48_00785 [Candidatus Staskawiczbacteria bacterium]|nr:hypothetical protein [Candidatus Staskawiczbacteria bacterium]
MNIRALIGLLLLVGLVIVFGIGIGILYKGDGTSINPRVKNDSMPEAIKLLSSKLVPSVIARGMVTKIDGMSITLIYQTESQPVPIKNDANISSLVIDPKSPVSKPRYITKASVFGDIKVNDNLEIVIKVLENGKTEGFNILILPAPAVAPTPVTK